MQDRVNNDGYYNHYRITTPEVGVFDAITTRMLEIRITEINALVTLKRRTTPPSWRAVRWMPLATCSPAR